MKIMIITASPNKDGLTAACGNAARFGTEAAGAKTQIVNLNELKVGNCQACGNGWGPCFDKHQCQVLDDFQSLHNSVEDFDGFVFVTPVYWGDISESAKAFLDRVRRCEAWKKEATYFQNKPFIAVAAAGGSGNGAMTTLTNIERLLVHIKADRFDYIGITKKSREYKIKTIIEASKAMVEHIKEK
ncbi:MAG: iron-sulfur protein [Clostridiales bacterium GWB2_37_7]|nr:MAG: iron-sulfur protein [Clostridiales bacterium GWB2_37_7]